MIGMPTYGRSFTLVDSTKFDIGAPASGGGTPGKYTGEAGFMSYYEVNDICCGITAVPYLNTIKQFSNLFYPHILTMPTSTDNMKFAIMAFEDFTHSMQSLSLYLFNF